MDKYTERFYKEIPITPKKSINVSVSERDSDGSKLVDIRQFILYHDHTQVDDGIKRATQRGIKFRLDHIPEVIEGLAKIYQSECNVEPALLFHDVLKECR